MVYKFRIISDEVDDFLREIQIDSEASFYDLLTRLLNVYSSSNFQKSSLEKIWTRQYALVKTEKLLNRPSILMNR